MRFAIQNCPYCGRDDVAESRVRNLLERLLRTALSIWPDRCRKCMRRYFRLERVT
jgi:hypothetical protein